MLSARAARTTYAALFLALAGLVGALLPASPAHAQSRTVQGGRLDWGIKASFQSYVTGPIAKGSWSLEGGAATVGGSSFRFHSAAGSYDPASGAFRAGFQGAVHFVGHRAKDGGYALDLTIGRPAVRMSGGSGTLYADMVSKDKDSGKVTRSSGVPLAQLNLSGVGMKGGGTPVALSRVPATLTAQGAKAFAGYYTAGTALDPVSLSVDVVQGVAADRPSPKTSATEQADKEKRAKEEQTGGPIEDAAVDWGVRRTYREYVTGSIARGRWTLSGGAEDGGAVFRFPDGKGTYTAGKDDSGGKDGTGGKGGKDDTGAKGGKGGGSHTGEGALLDARFSGTVRFTGRQGLDLTLGRIAVTVTDGKGTLYADVGHAGKQDHKRARVPLVTFDAGRLVAGDGLVRLTEAPAKLTGEGADAFDGLYRAGTAMDPVSLAVALDSDAVLPALPDLGSDASHAAAPAKDDVNSAAGTAGSSSSGTPVALWAGTGAGVLLVAAAALVLARRRRATPAAAMAAVAATAEPTAQDGPGDGGSAPPAGPSAD